MIDERAVIDPSAVIGKNVSIGPYSIIGPNVEIGEGTWIGPHVVVNGPTKIGKNNRFYQFSSIGEDPQDKKYAGEPTELHIGDDNIFREYVSISRGTAQDEGITSIGNRNLLMACVHIAHDCRVGNEVVFSNQASLAGHVIVEDFSNLGGFVGVHQFCQIGSYSFCAGGSIITKDVPPFVMVSGHPAQMHGLNTVGLRRRGFDDDAINALKQVYKIFYRQGLTVNEAIAQIQKMFPDVEVAQRFVQAVSASERGVVR